MKMNMFYRNRYNKHACQRPSGDWATGNVGQKFTLVVLPVTACPHISCRFSGSLYVVALCLRFGAFRMMMSFCFALHKRNNNTQRKEQLIKMRPLLRFTVLRCVPTALLCYQVIPCMSDCLHHRDFYGPPI